MILKKWKDALLRKSDEESLDSQAVTDLKNQIMESYKDLHQRTQNMQRALKIPPPTSGPSGAAPLPPTNSGIIPNAMLQGGMSIPTQSAYTIGSGSIGPGQISISHGQAFGPLNGPSTTISDLEKHVDDMEVRIKKLIVERDEARKYAELYRDKYIQLKRGVTVADAKRHDAIRKQLWNSDLLNQNDPVIKNIQEQFDSMFNEDQK